MPAVASSPIPAALHRLAQSGDVSRVVTVGPEQVADLRKHLAMVPDPRARRGVRHTLISILLVTAAAVIAGARSFTAVANGPPTRRNTSWRCWGHDGIGYTISTELRTSPHCGGSCNRSTG